MNEINDLSILAKDCVNIGLHIATDSELQKEEEEARRFQNVNFRLPYCQDGNLDRCPHKCGACLDSKIPKYAIYLGMNDKGKRLYRAISYTECVSQHT